MRAHPCHVETNVQEYRHMRKMNSNLRVAAKDESVLHFYRDGSGAHSASVKIAAKETSDTGQSERRE